MLDVVTNSVRSASVSVYEIADRFLQVEADAEWIAPALDHFLTSLRAIPGGVEFSTTPDVILKLSSLRKPEITTAATWVEISPGIDCYDGTDVCLINVHGSLVQANVSTVVNVWLSANAQGNPELLSTVFAYATTTALRRAGAFELHSAAVVEPESGVAALMVGVSGSGKSTLSLHLAARGWSYSTDDVLLLTARDQGVEAHGLRRVFAITDQTLAQSGLPELQHLSTGTGRDGLKKSFRPEEIFSSEFVNKCKPEVIFFPSRTEAGRSEVRPLLPSEAMQRLLAMCLWACFDNFTATGYLRALEGLVRQSRCFELLAGTDLLSNPDYTSVFLSSAIRN